MKKEIMNKSKTAITMNNQTEFVRKTMVTVKELSWMISTPSWTIRQWVRNKIITGYRPSGKRYLFDPNEVVAKIKEKSSKISAAKNKRKPSASKVA